MAAIWHLCLALSGGGRVWGAVLLWVSWSSLHRPTFQRKGQLQGFTFGDLPGFCSVSLALPVAFLLLELCLLLRILPDVDPKASEEDTGLASALSMEGHVRGRGERSLSILVSLDSDWSPLEL